MRVPKLVRIAAKCPPLRSRRGSLLASALLLATATTAEAKDLCISVPAGLGWTTGSGTALVGKGFRVPGRNRCKPFSGIQRDYGPAVGTGCTSTDGFTFTLHVTMHRNVGTFGGVSVFMTCGFNVPTGNGGCGGWVAVPEASDDELSDVSSTATMEPCTVNVP